MPGSTWKLGFYNQKTKIAIRVMYLNSTTLNSTNISEQVLIKISIINEKGISVLRKMKSSQSNWRRVEFLIVKKDIFDSKCISSDQYLSICCKIFVHVKKPQINYLFSDQFSRKGPFPHNHPWW